MRWSHFVLALAAAFGGAAAPGAQAADPVGPPMGTNKCRGTISGAEDYDDFTGMFLRGDVLTVAVTAAGRGRTPPTLAPVLTLIDPDGVERATGVLSSAGGRSLALRNFVIDRSGLWAARIRGGAGTAGDFLVSFRTKARAKEVYEPQRLGQDQPLSRAHLVPGFAGAVLDAKVTWTEMSEPLSFTDLCDPSGADVLTPAGVPAIEGAKRKGRSLTLKGVKLDGASGDYTLRVAIPTATAKYGLTVSVRNPLRRTSSRLVTLPAVEPVLDPVAGPFVATAGQTVRFTGTGFSTGRAPKVTFGSTLAESVTVTSDGRALDVVVPPRGADTVVPVYVRNPDGQGMGRDLYFAYLPAPEVTDLVDAATGVPVRVSPAAGGRAVRLLGANFEDTQTVSVGGVAVTSRVLVSPTEFRFTMPASSDGERAIGVADRYSRSTAASFTVRYKTPPSFAAAPYTPGAVKLATATTVTLKGSKFESSDQLWFAGQEHPSVWVDATTRTFDVPALVAGVYTVRLVDAIGTAVDGPSLAVKPPPTIYGAAVVAGPTLGSNSIPLAGGSTVRLDGSEFRPDDVVTLAGRVVTSFTTLTATRKEFLAPAGTGGPASLSITDGAGQSATLWNAFSYVGFEDVSWRTPLPSSADDWSAVRGATADLDGDGLADDVVLVSPYGNRPGSQARQTRVLLGGDDGTFADATNDSVPAAYGDPSGLDTWDANCVAIGDLDLSGTPDIVIGGEVAGGTGVGQVRLFRNDGEGSFALESDAVVSSRDLPSVTGLYYRWYYFYSYAIYGNSSQRGTEQAIALGDLDQDGDLDVVAGADLSQSRTVYWDPRYVDFGTYPPSIRGFAPVYYKQYLSALRILRNDLPDGGALRDDSGASLPRAGASSDTGDLPPAFHTRDLAVGDVNGDELPDIVVTWDDPLTVSHRGQFTLESSGTSQDTARVATRVLLNEPEAPGTFADATDAWMPAGSGAEYWQADRVLLADLDGDGDRDLVLSSAKGLDAWLGTPSHGARALRVLRNDGSRFTDVTASALPAVDAATSDDWRSDAITVRDVDGDGRQDLLAATTAALYDASNALARRLRWFRGGTGQGITFGRPLEFQKPANLDSGEATDLIFAEDPAGSGRPVLLELGELRPASSPSGRWFRAQEWVR